MNTLAKAVVSTVIAFAGALIVGLGTGNNGSLSDLSVQTWLIAAGTALASGGVVHYCENGPAAPTIKTVVAFLSAGVASLVTALDDHHITQAEYLVAFVAAVTATGFVYQVTGPKSGYRRGTVA